MAEAERDLARLIVGNAADDRVQRKRNEIRNLQQNLDVVRAKNRAAFRRILTAEQWQKLQEIKSRRRGR
jgi:Spy/CpxP family protein refolding chaperone